MATRDELVVALAGRYAASNRKERERILVEFAAVSGSPRKHAMRLLRAGCLARPCVAGYDPYLCRGRLRNEGQGFSQRRHHRPKRPSQRRHPAIIVGIFEGSYRVVCWDDLHWRSVARRAAMDARTFETWLGAVATLTEAQRQQAFQALALSEAACCRNWIVPRSPRRWAAS
jgi:hypothetical protein